MRYLYSVCILLFAVPLVAQTPNKLFEKAKQEGNLHTQIQLLSQVIASSPRHVGAYHYRADAYQALGNQRRAIADYNQVVALRPKDPFRYYARGLAYAHWNEPQLALADFTKAIALKPTYKNFYLARARQYRDIHKYGMALNDYAKYAGSWSKAPISLLEEVIPVSIEANRYDQAQRQLDAWIAMQEPTAQWYLWQGQIWQSEHKLDEAISAFSKAINRNKSYLQAYQWRGGVFKDMGDYEAAVEDYSRVVELHPDAYWFNRRGLVYEELKQFDKAAADYTQAIELDPKWAIAYNNRGYARMNLKQWEQAKRDFEKAIELDPSAPTPYINLAGTYWTYKKDRKHAFEYLQKALAHHFKNYDALFDDEQKGWMFQDINHTAEFRSLLYR